MIKARSACHSQTNENGRCALLNGQFGEKCSYIAELTDQTTHGDLRESRKLLNHKIVRHYSQERFCKSSDVWIDCTRKEEKKLYPGMRARAERFPWFSTLYQYMECEMSSVWTMLTKLKKRWIVSSCSGCWIAFAYHMRPICSVVSTAIAIGMKSMDILGFLMAFCP